ncbi:uncharacterized protein LOC120251854 [Dioscorea cayenensis subsp. rotundata]|uniref:Uncharacterized protein LOC120251854 n=1 Tax=Dioscorea cayennensis subsp. rotundata TaxID=55577 RepID=A0AB40ANK5_DIOCR|nr:uncharacterized protein LOC120251854 [Dioscorea cayenensis subsp. rotundata]
MTPIAATRMSLNLVITSTKGSWILTVVYNSQIVSSQRLLWFTLADINRICLPWLIFGDFNAILSTDDFKGGASNSYIFKSRFFSNFVNSNNLMDIGFVGPRFTWCNNQSGFARRWARLDRCLANLDWISKFSSLKNTHLPGACSDHCPLLLTANSFIAPSYSIFRFNNFWFEYNTCHDIIINSFEADNHSSPMQSIQHCLFRAKRDLLSWRRTGHCSIDIEISNIEAEISLMEARELQSMDPWLVVKSRINSLRDFSGNILTSRGDIENSFLDHYQNLWSSLSTLSLDQTFSILPDDFPTLASDDKEDLIKPVTKGEVFRTLRSMPRGKSPGPDGFNVEFYLFYWNVLGDHIFKAITHFFTTAIIPSSWGKTFVVLIPKVDHPQKVTDFRPISLCNVCYKLISKILAERLKVILPKLIGIEQSGFLEGRSTFDNIIAVHELAHSLEFDKSSPPRMLVKVDIDKAFDTVEWSTILATLRRMGFPDKWIS